MPDPQKLNCRCGAVELHVEGPPILSVECLCSDCQAAGALLHDNHGVTQMLDNKGATRFVMVRKDRITCTQGARHLREHRLKPDSTTKRVIASCCMTPVFLEFQNGHWLSLYGGLWQQRDLPPLQMRTMTRDAPDRASLDDSVPNPKTHTFSFYWKLVAAWAAMRFRTPKVEYVKRTLDAG